jgi:hypothetical protein
MRLRKLRKLWLLQAENKTKRPRNNQQKNKLRQLVERKKAKTKKEQQLNLKSKPQRRRNPHTIPKMTLMTMK